MATNRGRQWRRIATIVFVVVLFVPVMRGRDGVPLSRYPMYAAPQPDVRTFAVAHAFDADDNPVALSTRQIAGTGDPLIAESWLRTETRDGRAAVACAQVAARIAYTAAVRVEIVTEAHDLRRRRQREPSRVSSEPEASCRVG